MMRISQLQPLRSKKRTLIIGAAILLVVSIGGYIFWSKQEWAEYTPMYTQRYQDLQSNIKKAVALPVSNAKEQDAVLGQYKNISSRITTEQKSLCTINIWLEWQQRVVSTYKDMLSKCQKKTADIAAFQRHFDTAIAYIDNDQALAKIINTAAPAAELADSAWESQVSAWSNAIAATAKLSAGDAFKPTQERAVEKMSAVKQAWTDLSAAHQQKDKIKYLAAQNALSKAIDGLSEISIQSQRSFFQLDSELEKVSQKLYIQ